MSRVKRTRTPSSPQATTYSPTQHPTKAPRTIPATIVAPPIGAPLPDTPGLICTLPPTCQRHPTALANTKDLESHYAKYHAHVCEQRGCGCVFPDARLLELHQTECHDPLAAVRKERGEKTFACHVQTCTRMFLTPKARRLHLIQAHGYPKEFFFAVTNKGVGGLLKRWGEGASLVRKEWKERERGEQSMGKPRSDSESEKSSSDGKAESAGLLTPRMPTREPLVSGAEALAQAMSSLSLVPPSVRFGRGGRTGGLGRGRGRGNLEV